MKPHLAPIQSAEIPNLIKYGIPLAVGAAGLGNSIVRGDDIGAGLLNTLGPAGLGALAIPIAGRFFHQNPMEAAGMAGAMGMGLGMVGGVATDQISRELQQTNTPGFRNEQQRNMAKIQDYVNRITEMEMEKKLQQSQSINPEAYGSSNTSYPQY